MMQPNGQRPMFYYVIEVRRREFPLVIMPDGMSHWDDHSERRVLRRSEDRLLELYALAGDNEAMRQLGNELLEFTISVRVPDNIRDSARAMARKERLDGNARLGAACAPLTTIQDIAEMDRLLLDVFWKQINPLLSHPITR
jgi:hypothetical protein